ncbi:hypothetical protein Tco_0261374 [Tanacetum coccineum]
MIVTRQEGCRKVVRRFEDGHVDGMEVIHFEEWIDDFEWILLFQTCLTDILGFLEKLEWRFEQDIDVKEGRFEGDEEWWVKHRSWY